MSGHGRLRLLGAALPILTVATGWFIQPSPLTNLAIPLAFAVSGALIGKSWAPLPSVAVIAVLNLGELAGVGHSAAISLHAGDFSPVFLLQTCAIAGGLATIGALANGALTSRSI